VLYREEKGRFMTHQLYADSQTCVKNTLVTLAKQQVLDPTQAFYTVLLGSDGDEKIFALSRQIGGHSPNFGLDELADRMGSAMDIQRVYDTWPEWYAAHQRLAAAVSAGKRGDNASPKHWPENICISGTVDICRAWLTAGDETGVVLRVVGLSFTWAIFDDPSVGNLRPCGDGFVGVRAKDLLERDDSQEHVPEADLSDILYSPSQRRDPPSAQPLVEIIEADDSDNELETESDILVSPLNVLDAHSASDPFAPDGADDDTEELPHAGIPPSSLHEALGEQASCGSDSDSESDTAVSRFTPKQDKQRNDYLLCEGKLVHKRTLVRMRINTLQPHHRTKDRPLRARGFQPAPQLNFSTKGLIASEVFVVGSDCVATCVRMPSGTFLAIAKCTRIIQAGSPVQWIERSALTQPASRIELKAQILGFMQHITVDSEPAVTHWLWDFQPPVAFLPVSGSETANEIIEIEIRGTCCLPVSPSVDSVPSSSPSVLPHPTLRFTHQELVALLGLIQAQVCNEDAHHLPSVGRSLSKNFPYQTANGTACVI
jgi:hypothetical protein